ncbi:MAG: hypothetical protein RR726_12450, partial [Pseudomonas sp.]
AVRAEPIAAVTAATDMYTTPEKSCVDTYAAMAVYQSPYVSDNPAQSPANQPLQGFLAHQRVV